MPSEPSAGKSLPALYHRLDVPAQARLRPYLTSGDESVEDLLRRIRASRLRFESAGARTEFVDAKLAGRLYARAEQALQLPIAAEDRPVLVAALHYLMKIEDDEHDLQSPLGLEDDAEVWNEVCRALGWPHMQVELQ